MIHAAARLPLARLTRSRRALIPVAAWCALGIAAALVERSRQSVHAADYALIDPFGGFALPLLAYVMVGAALSGGGLARSGRSLVAFGAPPARVALATLLVAATATAVVAAVLGALIPVLAHGAMDPPLFSDVATTLWVAALGGAAYAALFVFGASLFQSGAGRATLLAADWILGSGTGGGAALTPRAHLRNLLGGAPPLEMSERASSLSLVLLGLAFGALAVWRVRRAK
jgi:hypothetical protein